MNVLLLLGLLCVFTGVASSDTIEFTIALKQQNLDILKESLENVSDPTSKSYGKYCDSEWIRNLVSPDSESSQKLHSN